MREGRKEFDEHGIPLDLWSKNGEGKPKRTGFNPNFDCGILESQTMNYRQACLPYIGLKEDDGANNDHKGRITAMLKAVGAAPGSSWCAAFVSQIFRDCGCKSFPASASSQVIKRSFQSRNLFSTNPQDLLKWHGAVAGWTDSPDTAHGHVFLVLERLTDSTGKLTGIMTFEGNTNSDGSANGDGCYYKKRMIGLLGQFHPVDDHGNQTAPARALWFGDTSNLTGGSIW